MRVDQREGLFIIEDVSDKVMMYNNTSKPWSVKAEEDGNRQTISLKRKIIIVLISLLIVVFLLPISIKFKMLSLIIVLLIVWLLIPNSDKSEIRARFLIHNPGSEDYPSQPLG